MDITLHVSNPDDEKKFNRMLHADKMFSIMWDIDQKLRTKIKHEDCSPEAISFFEELRGDIMGANFDELYD